MPILLAALLAAAPQSDPPAVMPPVGAADADAVCTVSMMVVANELKGTDQSKWFDIASGFYAGEVTERYRDPAMLKAKMEQGVTTFASGDQAAFRKACVARHSAQFNVFATSIKPK